MSQVRRVGKADMRALLSTDGTIIEPNSLGYVTLGVATYLFAMNVGDSIVESCQIITDAAIAGTFTVEGCNVNRDAVTDWVNTGSVWTQINPSTALVDSSGTGWTWTALSGLKSAGVGSALINLGNLGIRRARIKAAITTGGDVRMVPHGKS